MIFNLWLRNLYLILPEASICACLYLRESRVFSEEITLSSILKPDVALTFVFILMTLACFLYFLCTFCQLKSKLKSIQKAENEKIENQ